MNFVETFGLNPRLLLAQIVNFLLLLYLLNRFLYKPVLRLLKEREERIQKGLQDARLGEELLEKAGAEEQKILKNARNEAQEILGENRDETARLRQLFDEKMRQDKERLLKDAREEIAQQRLLMEKQLMDRVTKIALEIIEKTLQVVLSSEDRKKIVMRAEKQIVKHLPS